MAQTQDKHSTLSVSRLKEAIDHEFKQFSHVVDFFKIKEKERRKKKALPEVGKGFEHSFKSFHTKLTQQNKTQKKYEEYFEWFINGLKNALKRLIEDEDGFLEKDDKSIYVPIAECGKEKTIQLKRWEIFGIISSTIFNVQWSEELDCIGNICIEEITTSYPVSTQRLICMFAYLHVMMEATETTLQEVVIFERVAQEKPHDWENDETPIKTYPFVEGGLEMSTMGVHVDFANKYIHIHQIIPSVTQEELLFSVRPECFVSLLLFEVLEIHEAALIKNTLHISTSTGYQDTFQWTGFCSEQIRAQQNTILAIDSVINTCFGQGNIVRDLNKCYVGFKSAGNGIATGQWGCGAFNNHPLLKMIQQYMVLSTLKYKASMHWMSSAQFYEYNRYLEACQKKQMTVKDLYKIICSFNGERITFINYFKKEIDAFKK